MSFLGKQGTVVVSGLLSVAERSSKAGSREQASSIAVCPFSAVSFPCSASVSPCHVCITWGCLLMGNCLFEQEHLIRNFIARRCAQKCTTSITSVNNAGQGNQTTGGNFLAKGELRFWFLQIPESVGHIPANSQAAGDGSEKQN